MLATYFLTNYGAVIAMHGTVLTLIVQSICHSFDELVVAFMNVFK